ncbi:MAG: phosphoribosylanthranilate isomerase [Planctomycetota bacterium]
MDRTRIKICCIGSTEEAALAVGAGADAIGLVASMPSGPGAIADDAIARIAARTPPPVARFLLTSRTDAAGITEHVAGAGVDTLQAVHHLDPDVWRELASVLPGHVRRVQVIHVEDEGALALADRYRPFVDAFLLDSGRPSLDVPELGGTGRVHDWGVSARFVATAGRPTFLAGGLHAENVAEAIRTVRPFGVDICSGVRVDGRLDPDRLDAFVRAVRAGFG